MDVFGHADSASVVTPSPESLLPVYVLVERTAAISHAGIQAELNESLESLVRMLQEEGYRSCRLSVLEVGADTQVVLPLCDPADLLAVPCLLPGSQASPPQAQAPDISRALSMLGDKLVGDGIQMLGDGFMVLPPICLWVVLGVIGGYHTSDIEIDRFLFRTKALSAAHICVVAAAFRRNPLIDSMESKTYLVSA